MDTARHLPATCLLVALAFGAAAAAESKPSKPPESELSSIVGHPLPQGFKKVQWLAGGLPATNLPVYAVQPSGYDQEFVKRLAGALGVTGTLAPLPADLVGAPGYWVKETNPTNPLRYATVALSTLTGYIAHGSGEDNHRWDLKNHRPLTGGVPTAEEALQKTLALLPLLGLSTNDLERHPDSTLRWDKMNDGTWYTDRADGERKRYIRQMNITLWQRMPDGGSTIGVGGGGALRAGFMSEGKLAELELLFRRVKLSHTVKPKTKAEVILALRKGRVRTFYENVPTALTVTNCTLVYPQGNELCRQSHLWPFYSVKGFAVEQGETNGAVVYVPAAW